MAAGCKAALSSGLLPTFDLSHSTAHDPDCSSEDEGSGSSVQRKWFEDPTWVEEICESLPFQELFRYRFKKGGHINCLECRVYKSWLKHCAKKHPHSRIVSFLDSRVTMGAAAKGRSSSKALSRILRTSLGYIIGDPLGTGQMAPPEIRTYPVLPCLCPRG